MNMQLNLFPLWVIQKNHHNHKEISLTVCDCHKPPLQVTMILKEWLHVYHKHASTEPASSWKSLLTLDLVSINNCSQTDHKRPHFLHLLQHPLPSTPHLSQKAARWNRGPFSAQSPMTATLLLFPLLQQPLLSAYQGGCTNILLAQKH